MQTRNECFQGSNDELAPLCEMESRLDLRVSTEQGTGVTGIDQSTCKHRLGYAVLQEL